MTDQESRLAVTESNLEAIKITTDKILKILTGNGSEGLTTKVALNKQSIKRVWWWVGGITTGIAGFVIQSLLF